MPLSTTNKAVYQQYKSSLRRPLCRKKIYDKVTPIISLIVMSAAYTDKIILIFVYMKTIAKKTLAPSFVTS